MKDELEGLREKFRFLVSSTERMFSTGLASTAEIKFDCTFSCRFKTLNYLAWLASSWLKTLPEI